MRKMLKIILAFLSRRVLARYRPLVIGVTGSVGKTSAKDAIAVVLERKFRVRKSSMTLNDEIGVPLSVLGIAPAGTHLARATSRSRWGVVAGIFKAIYLAYGPFKKSYPNLLVLEIGAGKPGDIAYLTELTKPVIAVVTAVGEIPAHAEFYPDAEAVAKEKAKILKFTTPPLGISILNLDDPRVAEMQTFAPGPVMTFGFSEKADVRAADPALFFSDGHSGLSFSVFYQNRSVRFRVPYLIGVHQIGSVLIAVSVGLHLGMTLAECALALEEYRSPDKRMSILKGIKDTLIIDDTYNASPLSMSAALNALKQYPGKRKIAILGDMKELGKYAEEAHKKIAAHAALCADIVITVGELWGSGQTVPEVITKIKNLILPGDIILIKGSRAMQMEQIVDAIKA